MSKKETFLMIGYYILMILVLSLIYFIAAFFGNIDDFSKIVFNICFIFIPILLLLIPLIIKFKMGRTINYSLRKTSIIFLGYFFLVILFGLSINFYFKTFTVKKWNNKDWHSFRYLMVSDFDNKYTIYGRTREQFIKLLGQPDYNLDEKMIYITKKCLLKTNYYVIFLDRKGSGLKAEARVDSILYSNSESLDELIND